VKRVTGDTERAVALFHAVRDGIRYDPYNVSYAREAFRASTVATSRSNWCVPKSILLVAAARHVGIPARLGFADVRNHLTSEKLSAQMGTDLFAWHGYAELLLPDPTDSTNGRRWFKLSTAFNIELCDRFGVRALEYLAQPDVRRA
jgi:transglutaminase-like putative cysteine protease